MNDEATIIVPKNQSGILPGTVLLGTYAVDSALASGGMAKTYLTHHKELNNIKQVIKVIKPEFASDLASALELTHSEADDKSIALLKHEAEALLSIHHEAVVGFQGFQKDTVYGHCLIMEYVEGPSLKQYLQQHTLTVTQFWQLRDRLAGGLAAAHAKGIFHRDVSPDNVILPDGNIEEAKLIDFGIAKSHKPRADGTVFGGVFVGKYAYAAPEQLLGGTVGAYSDIYSLGLLLAEAIMGKRFEMGGSESAAKNARLALPDLSPIPPALRAQFKAMLQPNPALRPQSIAGLLQSWPNPDRTSGHKSKLNSRWLIAAIAVLITLGLGLYLSKNDVVDSLKKAPPSQVISTIAPPETAVTQIPVAAPIPIKEINKPVPQAVEKPVFSTPINDAVIDKAITKPSEQSPQKSGPKLQDDSNHKESGHPKSLAKVLKKPDIAQHKALPPLVKAPKPRKAPVSEQSGHQNSENPLIYIN